MTPSAQLPEATSHAFAAWLSKEHARGLQSIHLTVAAKADVSPVVVIDELLRAEAALASGHVVAAPRAQSELPASVKALLAPLTLPRPLH
jgi:hypothetical protein